MRAGDFASAVRVEKRVLGRCSEKPPCEPSESATCWVVGAGANIPNRSSWLAVGAPVMSNTPSTIAFAIRNRDYYLQPSVVRRPESPPCAMMV